MPINEEAIDAISAANLKEIAALPSELVNLLYSNTVANINLSQQNAVANQQSMNELGIAILSKLSHLLGDSGSKEALSAADVLTNEELQKTIADLKEQLTAYGTHMSEEVATTPAKSAEPESEAKGSVPDAPQVADNE